MADEPNPLNPLTVVAQSIPPGWMKAAQDRTAAAIGHLVSAKFPKLIAESQANKDDRDARSSFRRGMVEAAIEKAQKDPELVDRMLDRLVSEEFGKQENREAVAVLAIEHLSAADAEPPLDDAPSLDDDWLNTFTSHAERASSDRLRDMWARVLAGEIRQPGAISLRTIQFISTLDKPVVDAVQALLPWILSGRWLPHAVSRHVPLSTLQLARDEGLIGSLDTDLTTTITYTDGPWCAGFGPYGVFIEGDPSSIVTFPSISISRIMKDLTKIIPLQSSTPEPSLAFAELMKAHPNTSRVSVGPISSVNGQWSMPHLTRIMFWERPAAE